LRAAFIQRKGRWLATAHLSSSPLAWRSLAHAGRRDRSPGWPQALEVPAGCRPRWAAGQRPTYGSRETAVAQWRPGWRSSYGRVYV